MTFRTIAGGLLDIPIQVFGQDGNPRPLTAVLKRFNLWPNPAFRKVLPGGVLFSRSVRVNCIGNPALRTTVSNWTAILTGSTVTRFATGGPNGTDAYAEVTTPGTSAQEGLAVAGISSFASNHVGSIMLRVPSGSTSAVTIWLRLNYSDATSSDGSLKAVTLTNAWQTFTTNAVTYTAGKTVTAVQFFVRTNAAIALTFQAARALIEPNSDNVGTYFDGATAAAGDFAYGWVSTADASQSYEAAHKPSYDGALKDIDAYTLSAGSTNSLRGWVTSQSTPSGSGKVFRVESRRAAGQAGGQLLVFSLGAAPPGGVLACAPGDFASGKILMRSSSGNAISISPRLGYYANVFTNYATSVGNVTLPADGSWVEVDLPCQLVAPAGTTNVRWMIYAGTAFPLCSFDIGGLVVEKVSGLGVSAPSYFDGATAASLDYTYAWTGTADASSSVANP